MNLLRIKTVQALLVFLIITCTCLSKAQDSAEPPAAAGASVGPSANTSPRLKNNRKQTLNFEDELVEGSAQKPELFYLFQKKNFNYKRLIKLRENFLPEMRRTTEDIQRLRGGR